MTFGLVSVLTDGRGMVGSRLQNYLARFWYQSYLVRLQYQNRLVVLKHLNKITAFKQMLRDYSNTDYDTHTFYSVEFICMLVSFSTSRF